MDEKNEKRDAHGADDGSVDPSGQDAHDPMTEEDTVSGGAPEPRDGPTPGG